MDVIRRKLFDANTRRKIFASRRKDLAFARNILHFEGQINFFFLMQLASKTKGQGQIFENLAGRNSTF